MRLLWASSCWKQVLFSLNFANKLWNFKDAPHSGVALAWELGVFHGKPLTMWKFCNNHLVLWRFIVLKWKVSFMLALLFRVLTFPLIYDYNFFHISSIFLKFFYFCVSCFFIYLFHCLSQVTVAYVQPVVVCVFALYVLLPRKVSIFFRLETVSEYLIRN